MPANNNERIERVAVVAAAENGAIGKDGWMPWELPEDLKRFKALTLGKPMILGRVTFEAIGRPLPKRTNIVVTRDKDWSFDHENVRVCHDIETAIRLADEIALRDGINEVIIAGGAQIYHLALPFTTRFELTEVHAKIDGDTFLDPLAEDEWRETARQRIDNPDGPDYSFVTLDRI
ncbi:MULTISPECIES: dihydrofolate reductase [Thalassospira]|jgi:dihydrofolate reductase|uniref:Dihydrofolate reductase n=1 Tax=Thalassospira povalilytica TaxID=732237 RepID=A0ABX4R5D8_9PROT|nr:MULTISPECIES: dihydrofolate reductase [Thalassospira]MEE3046286.1 dihydrofolate reductase [Pseudomonadota bacterium]RCK22436.1 dihydrofolate reductase [Thalassospira profundimaris]KZB69779.1 dihydrofolate reductase [Thalassospira sp. MCCC 1A02491]MAL40373.1 dihydrofolate reductase [Thalassospira sp.]MBO6773057.1 dihydrofolate reductase [Thalassospira sp.]|tara:strand:- start:848 stop:1375 length:528 start_codon:yes stop_codon:yes gene_type:complete